MAKKRQVAAKTETPKDSAPKKDSVKLKRFKKFLEESGLTESVKEMKESTLVDEGTGAKVNAIFVLFHDITDGGRLLWWWLKQPRTKKQNQWEVEVLETEHGEVLLVS